MRALRLFQELLPDCERVRGHDHPHTFFTRSQIAYWTGETGEGREALRLFQELLPDQERVQGRDHPHTLNTLRWVAVWTVRNGDSASGRWSLREGLAQPRPVSGSRAQ